MEHHKRRYAAAAALLAAGGLFSVAGVYLLLRTVSPLCAAAAVLLWSACLGYGAVQGLRQLRALRETAQVLEQICAGHPDYMLDEEFTTHMGLVEKANHVLRDKTAEVQEEYESTLLSRQAELFSLQAQINPHFLYNTLDAIRGQAVTDGAFEIAETIEALANLFKYNISRKEHLIPLRLEVDNLLYYMKIQKYCYPDKINLELDIANQDDRLLNICIPKLTLQPIIENAICHGLEPKLGRGVIRLRVFTVDDALRITVADDGVGMDEDTLLRIKRNLNSRIPLSGGGHGIALQNANQRIRHCFGPRYGLDIYSTKGIGTRVELTFPYRKERYGAAQM